MLICNSGKVMHGNIDYTFDAMCLNTIRNKVLELTNGFKCKVFLFGSRANGTFKRGSDIDIGFQKISKEEFLKVRDELSIFWEDSIVPYKIDLVNFESTPDDFKKIALKEIVVWKKG